MIRQCQVRIDTLILVFWRPFKLKSYIGMTTSYLHGAGDVLDPDYVYPGGDLWTGENMVVDRPNLTPI